MDNIEWFARSYLALIFALGVWFSIVFYYLIKAITILQKKLQNIVYSNLALDKYYKRNKNDFFKVKCLSFSDKYDQGENTINAEDTNHIDSVEDIYYLTINKDYISYFCESDCKNNPNGTVFNLNDKLYECLISYEEFNKLMEVKCENR